MKLFNRLKNSVSYYIFSFTGWIYCALLLKLYLIYRQEIFDTGSFFSNFGYLIIAMVVVLLGLIGLSVVIAIFEYVFRFKIKYQKFIDNKFIYVISFIGVILALLEIFIVILFFVFLSF